MTITSKDAHARIKDAQERKTALEYRVANEDLKDEEKNDLLAEINNTITIIKGYQKILYYL